MKLLFYIVFFNPIVVLIADWAAWWFIGPEAALALVILPMLVWISGQRKGFWNYLASLQVFYLSCLLGGLALYHGLQTGDMYWIIGGMFLLLPAAVIACMLVLFG